MTPMKELWEDMRFWLILSCVIGGGSWLLGGGIESLLIVAGVLLGFFLLMTVLSFFVEPPHGWSPGPGAPTYGGYDPLPKEWRKYRKRILERRERKRLEKQNNAPKDT